MSCLSGCKETEKNYENAAVMDYEKVYVRTPRAQRDVGIIFCFIIQTDPRESKRMKYCVQRCDVWKRSCYLWKLFLPHRRSSNPRHQTVSGRFASMANTSTVVYNAENVADMASGLICVKNTVLRPPPQSRKVLQSTSGAGAVCLSQSFVAHPAQGE